jgi:arylsulfatase A-like enzyme
MPPVSAIRNGDWKLVHYYEDNRDESYNLQKDPSEQHDLAKTNKIKGMKVRTKFDTWRNETRVNAPSLIRIISGKKE